jgi:hypothetical protein
LHEQRPALFLLGDQVANLSKGQSPRCGLQDLNWIVPMPVGGAAARW